MVASWIYVLLSLHLYTISSGLTIRLWPINERETDGFVEVFNNNTGEWGFLGEPNYRYTDLSASYLCKTLQISEFGYGAVWTPLGSYTAYIALSHINCDVNGTCITSPYTNTHEIFFSENATDYTLRYANSLHCVDSRIVGDRHYEGILQTAIHGEIYTSCFDGFDMNAAEVACNHLGFNGAVSISAVDPDDTRINSKVFICNGSEPSLLQCNQSRDEMFDCEKIVQITCKAARLVSTNEYTDEGAVEVFYNGTWGHVGTVAFVFSERTASYLCDSFGLGKKGFGVMTHSFHDYDRMQWYEYMECLGNETNIMQCYLSSPRMIPPRKYPYGSGSWLYCFDFNITDFRLVNGTSYSDGRVQLEINGRWGSICYSGQPQRVVSAGDLMCRAMGFMSLESVYEETGSNTDLIWLDELFCGESISSLTECYDYRKGAYYTCFNNPRYLGLQCNDYNDCEPNPCFNGGTCTDDFRSFACKCPRPWGGTTCEIDIEDNCVTGSCFNNGTCLDRVETFVCSCVDGFDGERCQNNLDDCPPSTCKNGGSCEDKINGYICYCKKGFEGKDCENEVEQQSTLLIILVSGAAAFLVIVAVITICFCVRYRRNRGKSGKDNSPPQVENKEMTNIPNIDEDKGGGYTNLYSTISDNETDYSTVKADDGEEEYNVIHDTDVDDYLKPEETVNELEKCEHGYLTLGNAENKGKECADKDQ